MTFDWLHGDLAEGLCLYNAGQYFAAHESWEVVWLAAPEPEKTFLQALIQVTAAFEHQLRNNPLGTQRLLEAALRRLDPFPPAFGGISLAHLRNDIRDCLQTLTATPPNAMPTAQLSPPRIHPL